MTTTPSEAAPERIWINDEDNHWHYLKIGNNTTAYVRADLDTEIAAVSTSSDAHHHDALRLLYEASVMLSSLNFEGRMDLLRRLAEFDIAAVNAAAAAKVATPPAVEKCITCGHLRSYFRNGFCYRDIGQNKDGLKICLCKCEFEKVATGEGELLPDYATFEAGWNAGFQEAQEPDKFPWQNRCEVRYRELFRTVSPATAEKEE